MKLTVLVKGKKHEITFREKDVPRFKNSSMEGVCIDSNNNDFENNTENLEMGTQRLSATINCGKKDVLRKKDFSPNVEEERNNGIVPTDDELSKEGNSESIRGGETEELGREDILSVETIVPESMLVGSERWKNSTTICWYKWRSQF